MELPRYWGVVMSELARSEHDPIDDAQAMGEWFADYMYGLIDEIGFVPNITKARIGKLIGPDASLESAVPRLRDMILDFADEVDDQTNAVLYVCGYPDEMIAQFGMGDTDTTVRKIEHYFGAVAPHETTELPRPVSIAKKVAQPALRQTVHKSAVKNTCLSKLDEEEDTDFSVMSLKTYELQRERYEDVRQLGVAAETEHDSWQVKALCKETDPELFFPEKGGSTREAKGVCVGCEVKAECLEHALKSGERFGIWGGLSERERRRVARGIV